MREVKINIDDLRAEYAAGTRNENNATKLAITPPAQCKNEASYYLLMFESQLGKLSVSNKLTPNADGVIEFDIDNSLTHTAYQMVSLVAYQRLMGDIGVEMIYRSTQFKLIFKEAVNGDQYIDEPNRGYIAELLGLIKSGMMKGADGLDGRDGADGISVVNAEIVMQHLILELSDGSRIDAGIVDESLPYYGVCRDRSSHSPTLTRCGNAVGLEANKGIGAETVVNDFDFIYPYSEMRRCTVADDGTVTSYKGDVNYTEDGSIGQVMVEIPKFYVRHYIDAVTDKEYWYISKFHIAGFRLSQAFYDAAGNELDKIYIGAFPATLDTDHDNMVQSIAGKEKYLERALGGDMIEYCAARGDNWHEIDAMEYADVIVPLFLVEWATLDTQSVFTATFDTDGEYAAAESTYGTRGNIIKVDGISSLDEVNIYRGAEVAIDVPANDTAFIPGELDEYYAEEGEDPYYTAIRKVTRIEIITPDGEEPYLEIEFDGSPILMSDETVLYPNAVRNGVTNDVAASSGECFYSAAGGSPWVWRGIENLYGNDYTWLAGILIVSSQVCVWEDLRQYVSRESESRISLGYNIPAKNNYITDLGYNAEHPWACFPAEGGGTSDTDFCDMITQGASGMNRYYAFGGDSAPEGGLFGVFTTTTTASYRAGRLSYKSFCVGGLGDEIPQ